MLDEATTGPLRAEHHGWSKSHEYYNQAVREQLGQFLERNNVQPEAMTPAQAQSFVDQIKRSSDPRIKDFNLRIFRREFRYLLRYGPRTRE